MKKHLLHKTIALIVAFTLSLSIAQSEFSLVVRWNKVALQAISHKSRKVTAMARALYMVHQAMYDAWALYDDTAMPVVADPSLKRPQEEHTQENKAAAVSQAGFTVLVSLFPEYERASSLFSDLLRDLGYEPYRSGNNTPEAIGFQAAQAVLIARVDDGANAKKDFVDVVSDIYPKKYQYDTAEDPNLWHRLTVPTGILRDDLGNPIIDKSKLESFQLQRFATPHWGAVQPFALESGDQFRPSPPAMFGSSDPYTDALGNTTTNDQAFRKQVEEIWNLSVNLTDEQRAMSEYWADGPRSETPPGHWNALAQGLSVRDQHSLDQDVKMFFALNSALFDASIACWDAKRAYGYVRPIQAIRSLFDDTWQPYQLNTFVTPPFPEYPSGHSTFSAAAAEVLTRFTGSNAFYDGVTVLPQDVNRDGKLDLLGQYIAMPESSKLESGHPLEVITLQWETFQEAADEAGMSRRYGGIHFQDGDVRGRELGTSVGAWVFDKAQAYWQGNP
jgi:PAP2 superfamily